MTAINVFSAKNPDGRIDVTTRNGCSFSRAPSSCAPGVDGEHTLKRGDLLRFPSGPDGAHKLSNRSDSPARILMFSSARVPAVSVYPDSDKIGVWSGNEADAAVFRRSTAVRTRTVRKAGRAPASSGTSARRAPTSASARRRRRQRCRSGAPSARFGGVSRARSGSPDAPRRS